MKGYILNLASVYSLDEPDEREVERLQHDYNWFLINEGAKNFDDNDVENIIVQIEKNFIALCSVMEENGSVNPHKYTVIQFYGKLSYLNSQAQKDGE